MRVNRLQATAGDVSAGISILVVSCDAYSDLWRPYFSTLFKYWPDCPYPVYLGANRTGYDDPRVRSILVGSDVAYSSNLLAMLARVPTEWVILWIEDRVLAKPVDTVRFRKAVDGVMALGCGYARLISGPPYAYVPRTTEFGEIPKGSPYRVCMTVALWNKRVLQSLLVPSETAWDFEKSGSQRADDCDERFLAPLFVHRRNPLVVDEHLIVRGALTARGRKFLAREGLVSGVERRPAQPVSSRLYCAAYRLVKDVSASVRWSQR